MCVGGGGGGGGHGQSCMTGSQWVYEKVSGGDRPASSGVCQCQWCTPLLTPGLVFYNLQLHIAKVCLLPPADQNPRLMPDIVC